MSLAPFPFRVFASSPCYHNVKSRCIVSFCSCSVLFKLHKDHIQCQAKLTVFKDMEGVPPYIQHFEERLLWEGAGSCMVHTWQNSEIFEVEDVSSASVEVAD
ncbi:hypothetical protein ZIOFF_010923 [Zingiber officinale]|uniref:Uncharacterized protein n=1 Tax=Zingiber officinale TaxID=94328 RepID=A0A8J5LSD9_ZINOF|nr:hypothetical protein ZIOFF_010923 [Zingiber officinale]